MGENTPGFLHWQWMGKFTLKKKKAVVWILWFNKWDTYWIETRAGEVWPQSLVLIKCGDWLFFRWLLKLFLPYHSLVCSSSWTTRCRQAEWCFHPFRKSWKMPYFAHRLVSFGGRPKRWRKFSWQSRMGSNGKSPCPRMALLPSSGGSAVSGCSL